MKYEMDRPDLMKTVTLGIVGRCDPPVGT